MRNNKLKRIIIEPVSLFNFLSDYSLYKICVEGIPLDSKLESYYFDNTSTGLSNSGKLILIISSSTFPEVDDSQIIPKLEVTIKKLYE
ncbi:MAG: hypothetical protein AABY07_00945 [Nanoarchaeota archaeon]